MRTKILSSASYLPGRIVTNEDLAGTIGFSHEKLLTECGSKQRRFIASGETGSSMLADAARRALSEFGKEPNDLQAIFSSTLTPDHQFPGNSAFTQNDLGVAGQAILDIRGCDGGFLHTLQAAVSFVDLGHYQMLLLTANDIFSTYLRHSPDGAGETELFGDGAAVWILGPSDDDSGFLSIEVGNDPSQVRSFWAKLPGTILHPRMTREMIEKGEWHFSLDQKMMEIETRRLLPKIVKRALDKAGVSSREIKLFIPSVLKPSWVNVIEGEIGIPPDRVLCMHRDRCYFGTAMIPEGFDQAVRSGLCAKGDLILMAAVGAGIGFGAAVYRV